MGNNTVDVRFRIDKDLKKNLKVICEDLGMTMTEAFTLFAEKVAEINDIPASVKSYMKPHDKETAEMEANTAKTG